jgi:hypothetical protein
LFGGIRHGVDWCGLKVVPVETRLAASRQRSCAYCASARITSSSFPSPSLRKVKTPSFAE